jgi:hypothetical protein
MLILIVLAVFLRWYRLDNCTFASGDEWLAIGPTFQFLDKFARNPITAIGFEALAGVPVVEAGRMGPPFDYTRSMVLVWSMPYYGVVGLFDFPVSEGWYRFPGTVWGFLGVAATYYFLYQLTRRHDTALFGFGFHATLLAHLVQTRFLVADGVFVFWLILSCGLWLHYIRDRRPRLRHLAYLATTFYASSTPEALIGLAALFSLVGLTLWERGEVAPFRRPLAMLNSLRKFYIAYPLLWLAGFYLFQIMVEVKYYRYDRDMFLNDASYLGRFFGRGSGEWSFYPERVINWYIYPHISAALILAAALAVLMLWRKGYRAGVAWGLLWSLFWVTLTLLVSNSSSNFTRITPSMLALGALGITAIYDYAPRAGALAMGGAVLMNLWGIYTYPLLCPLPEDQNVAQAVGYLVQEYGEDWGGPEKIGFYFPTGSLFIYLPEDQYPRIPGFLGDYTFEGCQPQSIDPASMEGLEVVFALPPDYDTRQVLNKLLDYAVRHECEQQRNQAVEAYVRGEGFILAGQIVSEDGQVHANIWARQDLGLGQVAIETANQAHWQKYSRASWFSPN